MINIPGQVVASVAFGGKNLDVLYVSTFSKARATYTGDTIDRVWPNSGLMYAVTGLGTKGFPGRELCKLKGSCNKKCNQKKCSKCS